MKRSIVLLLALLMILSGCSTAVTTAATATAPTKAATATTKATTTAPTTTAAKKLTIGDVVNTGNFELKITKVEINPITNQFSSRKEAVAVYVEIKNISSDTNDILMLQHPFFGPDGKEAESMIISAYFADSINVKEKIRSGSTLTGYFVCTYLGDGEYVTKVSELMKNKIEIYFNVKK